MTGRGWKRFVCGSTCVPTVGPSELAMFTRITSCPAGPVYSNEWPLGPEEMTFAVSVAFAIAVVASDDRRFPIDDHRFPVRSLRGESFFVACGDSPTIIYVNDVRCVFRPKGPFVRIAQPIGLGFGPPPIVKGLKGRPFVRIETVVAM